MWRVIVVSKGSGGLITGQNPFLEAAAAVILQTGIKVIVVAEKKIFMLEYLCKHKIQEVATESLMQWKYPVDQHMHRLMSSSHCPSLFHVHLIKTCRNITWPRVCGVIIWLNTDQFRNMQQASWISAEIMKVLKLDFDSGPQDWTSN